MEQHNNSSNLSVDIKQPWYGSKASCLSERSNDGSFMTFQSRDPIISVPMEKVPNDKSLGEGGGGHHGHGLTVEHPTSYLETLMHMFKGNVGSGIFAMGDALKNSGILLGPFVIALLGLVCNHCQHLLLDASRTLNEKHQLKAAPDFAETVGLCFEKGPPKLRPLSSLMKTLVNVFLCVTQLGFCCVYFVFISENIKQVMDYYNLELGVNVHMAIILLPILLTSLVRNLKFLAPLSTIANVLMIIGMIIVLYYSSQNLPPISERTYVASPEQLPLFFGTALFAFEGIGLVLPLQNEMRKPSQFGSPLGVMNVGMFIVTILYIIIGFLAYLQYGEDVQGSVTLNLPKTEILAQSVKIIISCGILLTYALQFYIPVDIIWPGIQSFLGPMKHPVAAELGFRTALVLVTFILAEAIPYLNLFISLIGAVSSSALALVFPAILELVTRHSGKELTPTIILKDIIILLIGLVGMVTGGYESIKSIVNAFQAKD